jgi:hypothetical protein
LIDAVVDSVADAVLLVTLAAVALSDARVLKAELATLDVIDVALTDALVFNVEDAVRFVIFNAVALSDALVCSDDDATLAVTPVALKDALVDSVADAVRFVTFVAVALTDAFVASDADDTDATTAIAVTTDALVCQPADPSVVRAGGNDNVVPEPIVALAVFDVPPVLEPNGRPRAPNLGPAPIAWFGGNAPIYISLTTV